jgi:hypothetical protein
MDFLSDTPSSPIAVPSTFTDSIRIITLCGEVLTHTLRGAVEHAHNWPSPDFWTRQQHLDSKLTQSLEGLCLHDPCALVFQNPMSHFTALAAHAAVLMLYKASLTAPWGEGDYTEVMNEGRRKAVLSSQQIVSLSRALSELSYFKVC